MPVLERKLLDNAGLSRAGCPHTACRHLIRVALPVVFACLVVPHAAVAQTAAPAAATAPGWNADVEVKKSPPTQGTAKPDNMTVIERNGDAKSPAGTGVKLVALLTADGQQIDQGLVWRVFQAGDATSGKAKLITENRDASPSLKLPPGDYSINASFGRANLTRKVSVKQNTASLEQFVLNAGGLRLSAYIAGKPVPAGVVAYALFSDDRDQFANRTAIMTGAKPGLIIRLNAGIYRVVSTFGDSNARVETDVTVEAGKLTEAAVAHAAGKATFKLVTRTGGEALPDTHWTVLSSEGEVVKDSVGALPTHFFAPGTYTVTARSGGRLFKNQFAIKDGDAATIEVMMDGGEAVPETAVPQATAIDAEPIAPSLDIKNP